MRGRVTGRNDVFMMSDDTGAGLLSRSTVEWLQSVAFLVAVYEGVLPLIARGIFGARPKLSLPAHLDSPFWWVLCLGVIVVCTAAMAGVDRLAAPTSGAATGRTRSHG